MKDRIRTIMESHHMNQQVFANYIGIAAGSLSSIFKDRTRPTLNTVEAIRKAFPEVNMNWLLFGEGEMISSEGAAPETTHSGLDFQSATPTVHDEGALDFDAPTFDSSEPVKSQQSIRRPIDNVPYQPGRQSDSNVTGVSVKNVDKPKRAITEIRVFYDDQTWESFVPKK